MTNKKPPEIQRVKLPRGVILTAEEELKREYRKALKEANAHSEPLKRFLELTQEASDQYWDKVAMQDMQRMRDEDERNLIEEIHNDMDEDNPDPMDFLDDE